MRRFKNIILPMIMLLSVMACVIMLSILVFRQSAIPKFREGPAGKDAIVNYDEIYARIDAKFSGIPFPENGKDAVVDYNLLTKYIDDKFASIPHPLPGLDGRDGEDGSDGSTGPAGPSCTTAQTETGSTITCPDGTSSTVDHGRTPQIRCNETRNRWEVRYDSGNWSILNNKSTPCMGIPLPL